MQKRPIELLERRQMLSSDSYDWKPATIKGDGFIDGIDFSPTVEGLTYIHTDMGGAYRYDASKNRWTPLTDFAKYTDSAGKNMGTETLAVDPTNPDRVYVGLGTYLQNSAILRSTDRGQTWLRTDVPFHMNGNGSARNTGERMVVDPNSPNVLYYGTRDSGLWRSTDYAATWSKVTSFPTIGLNSGWGAGTGLLFVLFDKTSSTAGTPSQTIYVGVFDATAGVTRIYRSSDAGATWGALPGGQPTAANMFPQRAALTPDGRTLYITYATSTSYPGPYGVGNGNVYKVSNPAGAAPTWADVQPLPDTGYAYSGVAIDPTNANTIYISELGDYNPADRIWRSTNGGTSWTVVSPNSHRDDSSAPYASASKIHWMGDVEIDPLNHNIAMFTTGYGLYRTTNFTATQPSWAFFNDGFEQSATLEIASPNNGPVNLFTAIGDRDGYRHVDLTVSPAAGTLGQNNGMAEGTSPDIDVAWDDANYLVRVTQVSPYVQASSDNGITWTWLSSTGVTGGDGGHTAISGDGKRVIYEPGGTGNQLLYATRVGTTWSGWSAPATNRPADGSRILTDLVNGMTFYAQSGSTISRSTDGGVNWTVMTTSAPNNISSIRAVPGNAGNLIVSAGGIYRSTDGGATWTRLGYGIVTDAYQVGVGAAAPGKSYPSLFIAGTTSGATGFARSDDQGVTWTSISDVNHQFGYVDVIQGDPRVYGRLYVGTNGRGIEVGDILAAPTTLPTGWRRDDIGAPALAGQSGTTDGTSFTLAGNGTGIGINTDQFHFANSSVAGDLTISARIADVANTAVGAEAGVMVRADSTAGSAFAFVAELTNGNVVFSYRTSAGTSSQSTSPTGEYASAKYVRLIRAGNNFTASYSLDGATWVAVGTVTIAMPDSVRIGLAATSANTTSLSKALFTNVSIVTDTVAPTVSSTSFDFRAPVPTVVVSFSEDVSETIDASDVTITPADGSPALVPTSFTYDPITLTARFLLPTTLPDGDYHATLAAGAVSDRAGNLLVSATTFDFFQLPGDIDRDRSVGFSDLVIVAQHYGQTSSTFDDGDLNGDGNVDFNDLVLLAQHYGESLAPLARPAVVAVAASGGSKSASAVPHKRVAELVL